MAMTDLPRDLLEDILSRIPYESLRELRFTCKLWNALFKDRGFIKQRFHKPAREVVVMVFSWIYLLNPDLDGDTIVHAFRRLHGDGGISYLNLNQSVISDMFYCDGLLLLRTMENNKLGVWNPCSGKSRWIELMYHIHYTSGIFSLGYHQDLCDSYKVLSILDNPKPELYIYEFNSDSWRSLDDVILGCMIKSRGVSLQGNTYWIASQVKDFFLLSFDFATETFGRLNLPLQRCGYETLALSVVRDEKLSSLQQSLDTTKVKIWVTTNDKIDQTKVLSWTKFLAVDLNTYYDKRKFTCDVSFFIDEERKVAVCWDRGIVHTLGEDHRYQHIFSNGFGEAMFQGWFKFNLKGEN
ncbi:PREDICTED: putative F-box protein At3g17500 [Camelina sativa]|uniref:F-box protein At3g17500 n=1 Tax=Camelina sativa TaxID=90675 RepID=A0ABM0ZAY9_CAMSA|nr:PREDICTED: putative F-box protein At3g17500 [Camelina sativa]